MGAGSEAAVVSSTAERTSDAAVAGVSDNASGVLWVCVSGGRFGVLLRPMAVEIMGAIMRLWASRSVPGVEAGLLTRGVAFSLVVRPLVCAKAEERLWHGSLSEKASMMGFTITV